MTRYASTFIVGLKDFIETFLNEMLPTVKIHLLLDGLVVYQTSMNLRELKRLRCFNNTFLVLRMYKDLPADPVHALLERILKDKENMIEADLLPFGFKYDAVDDYESNISDPYSLNDLKNINW